ncbi:hypothetical protein SprV_0702353000 [Sparganum proliferum]
MTLPPTVLARWRLPRRLRNCLLITVLFLVCLALAVVRLLTSTRHNATRKPSLSPDQNAKTAVCAGDWYAPIRATINGSYRLFLTVHVDSNTSAPEVGRLPGINVIKHGTRSHLLSFEDMAEIDDRLWRLPVDNRVYLLYPQNLNLSDVVDRVKSCRVVPQSPANNHPLHLLHVSSTICPPVEDMKTDTGYSAGPRYDLVVIVKSAVYNFQSRKTFRSLYARLNDFNVSSAPHPFRIGLLFSVGLPRRSGNQTFKRDGFHVTLPGRAGEALVDIENTHSIILQRLTEEVLQYKDVLVGGYEDTYYNLTTKMMTNFQWAARFCRTERPGFLFMDDDYAFHPTNLRRFLARLEADWRERMVIGLERIRSPTVRFGNDARFNQWALSKREMPWPQLPPFSAGAFYFLGYERVEEVAIAMHFTRSLPLDDVWLGLVMAKLGLRFQYRPGIRFALEARSTRKRDIIMPMSAMYGRLTASNT